MNKDEIQDKRLEINPESETQHLQSNIDSAVVSLTNQTLLMNNELRQMMGLIGDMNQRISIIEARSIANKNWCKEFQQSADSMRG